MAKSLKTIRDRVWRKFSKYVRLKYADFNGYVKCFTCPDIKHYKEMHAGHYVHGKTKSVTFFDEKNVHPQCKRCNHFKGGRLGIYATNIMEKYGVEELERLNGWKRKNQPVFTKGKLREIEEEVEKKLESVKDKDIDL